MPSNYQYVTCYITQLSRIKKYNWKTVNSLLLNLFKDPSKRPLKCYKILQKLSGGALLCISSSINRVGFYKINQLFLLWSFEFPLKLQEQNNIALVKFIIVKPLWLTFFLKHVMLSRARSCFE